MAAFLGAKWARVSRVGPVFRRRCARQAYVWRDSDLNAWSDDHIRRHEPFDRAIERALAATHVMVLILTPRYAESEYCREEVAYALAHRDRIEIILAAATPSADRTFGIGRFERRREPDCAARPTGLPCGNPPKARERR
jgi:hypothetical protein